jgi:hypothetical protein
MNGSSKWKVTLYLLGIFLAGSASGWIVATRIAREKAFTPPRSDEIIASLRNCMRSRLDLSAAQEKKIDSILERSSTELQALHRQNISSIRQALSNRNVQLNAVLTSEQQRVFEQIEKERREAFRGTNAFRNRPRWHERNDGTRERRDRDRVTTNAPISQRSQ